ncbi:hypothetical protein BHM03_00039263 [Ensete ventricosum]|nr:hypothetical protein BHM03_00039263 [Ensete ventricosum]
MGSDSRTRYLRRCTFQSEKKKKKKKKKKKTLGVTMQCRKDRHRGSNVRRGDSHLENPGDGIPAGGRIERVGPEPSRVVEPGGVVRLALYEPCDGLVRVYRELGIPGSIRRVVRQLAGVLVAQQVAAGAQVFVVCELHGRLT